MDVRCERCKAEYKLDDARIPAGGASVRCSACGNVFRVGRPDGGAAVEEGGAAGGAAGRPTREWRLKQASGKVTTFKETATLQRWIVERKVSREDELSADGAAWRRLGDIPQLAPSFARADELSAAGDPVGGGPVGEPTPIPGALSPVEADGRSTLPFAGAPAEEGGAMTPLPGAPSGARSTQMYAAAAEPAQDGWGSSGPADASADGGSAVAWDASEEAPASRTGRQYAASQPPVSSLTPVSSGLEEGTAFYQYDAARLASLRTAAEAPGAGAGRAEPPAEMEVDADIEETPPESRDGTDAYAAAGGGSSGDGDGRPFSPFGDDGTGGPQAAGGGFQGADFQEGDAQHGGFPPGGGGDGSSGGDEPPTPKRRPRWLPVALVLGGMAAVAAAAFIFVPMLLDDPGPARKTAPPAAAAKAKKGAPAAAKGRADAGTPAGGTTAAATPPARADAGVRTDAGTALAQTPPAGARDAGPAAAPPAAVAQAPGAAPDAGVAARPGTATPPPAGAAAPGAGKAAPGAVAQAPAAPAPAAQAPAGGEDPAMFGRWLTFGDRRLQEGDVARALRSYDRAAAIDPASAEPAVRRGRALLKSGNAKGAVAEFEQALQKDASAGGALFGLGQAQEAAGDTDAAAKAYRRYLQVLPRGPQAAAARERLSELGGTQ
jgi:predicted Zn finger-like uncharacterized protein